MITENNNYNILGISNNSDIEDVKKAYKKLAKLYHPDINIDNYEKFITIKNAYDSIINNNIQNYHIKLYIYLTDVFTGKYIVVKYGPNKKYETMVQIPIGINDNTVLKIINNNITLNIRINIINNTSYIINDKNLILPLKISMLDILLKNKIYINHLNNDVIMLDFKNDIDLSIPLIIKYKGIPAYGNIKSGDLYINIIPLADNLNDSIIQEIKNVLQGKNTTV